MIPAPPGVVASFTITLSSGNEITSEVRVVAFADNGEALVVPGENGGTRLITVQEYVTQNPGYRFTFLDDASNRALGLVAGDGWSVERIDQDGTTRSTPVIAWALQWDGSLVPLAKHGDDAVEDVAGKYRLRHPFEAPDQE